MTSRKSSTSASSATPSGRTSARSRRVICPLGRLPLTADVLYSQASKGIGEPPFFLGYSAVLALRYALKSARADAGITEMLPCRLPMTSERIRLACADMLLQKGTVVPKEGQQSFFVNI